MVQKRANSKFYSLGKALRRGFLSTMYPLSLWSLWFQSDGVALLMSLQCWESPAEGVWMDYSLRCLMVRLEAKKHCHFVKKHRGPRQRIDDWVDAQFHLSGTGGHLWPEQSGD